MDKTKIVIVIIAGLVVLLFLDQLLKAVGLKKDARERKEEKLKETAVSDLRSMPHFDPLYYKGKAFKPLGKNLADTYAKDLRKATRFFGTDEELVYSTFGKLNNLTNISEVAESYYLNYGEDLRALLLTELNDKEKASLMSVIIKLPES